MLVETKRRETCHQSLKGIVTTSIWILFLKGLLVAFVTSYTISTALWAGETTPMVGVAGCAVGSLAFILACVGVWIRKTLD